MQQPYFHKPYFLLPSSATLILLLATLLTLKAHAAQEQFQDKYPDYTSQDGKTWYMAQAEGLFTRLTRGETDQPFEVAPADKNKLYTLRITVGKDGQEFYQFDPQAEEKN